MWNSDSQGPIVEIPRPSISGGQADSTPRDPVPHIAAHVIIALRDSGREKPMDREPAILKK